MQLRPARGAKNRPSLMPAAVAVFLPVLAVLTLVCVTLERLMNRTTTWLLAPTTMGATARAGAGSVPP